MTDHPTTGSRRRIATVALIAALVGGAVGIDVIGSGVSSEIGHREGSTSTLMPAPSAPGQSHQAPTTTS